MIEDREEYIKPNAIASNAAGDINSALNILNFHKSTKHTPNRA